MTRGDDDRAARLAEALRANLRRRKAQTRARAAEPLRPEPPAPPPATPAKPPDKSPDKSLDKSPGQSRAEPPAHSPDDAPHTPAPPRRR